jgi:hypothetical protein
MAAVIIAPWLMPDSYSMVEHSISESGAQGIQNAWVARSAFLFVGLGIMLLTGVAGDLWGRWGTLAFQLYAVATLAAGAFAHGPWEEVPFDRLEGFLHTAAAFFAGLGFGVGVLAISLRRDPAERWRRALDWLALVSVAVLPVTMLIFDAQTGIQQRFLVSVGFAWLIAETIRVGWGDQPRARASDGS